MSSVPRQNKGYYNPIMNRKELVKQLQFATKLAKSLRAKKGIKDLYYFNKHILEQDEARRENIVPHVHGEWAEWHKQSDSILKMILVPRHTLKSSFFTVGGTLQMIAANPNVRILIASATLQRAQNFLADIKDHIQNNESFIENYGDFYNPNGKWTETEIIVKGRDVGIRDPTVVATGVGANIVGSHFDHIWWDDLVDDQNIFTREQAKKVIEWWERTLSLPDPKGGTGTLIGTRWSHYDLYQHILDSSIDMDTYIRGAYNEDGSAYYPEMLNKTVLRRIKKSQSPKVFSAFYLNDPVDTQTQLVKRDYLHTYPGICRACGKTHHAPDQSKCTTFITCDPAVSSSTKADNSAIIVTDIDGEDNWWVRLANQGRWSVQELIDRLFVLNKEFNPAGMSIEVIGLGGAILQQIHEQENTRGIYLPLKDIKSRAGQKKESRIRSTLQARFERNKVFIRNDMTDLIEEVSRYPDSKHDDLVDALADVAQIGFKPDEPESGYKPPVTMEERVNDYLDSFNDPYPFDPVLGTDF